MVFSIAGLYAGFSFLSDIYQFFNLDKSGSLIVGLVTGGVFTLSGYFIGKWIEEKV
jgi:hypothetical protein